MNIYWKIVMFPIINQIQTLNIMEITSKKHELTENILEYCETKNAQLTLLNPIEDQTLLEYSHEYGDTVKIINKNVLEQIPFFKNYDVLIINLTGDYQELYQILNAVKANSTKFPVIFIMNMDDETEIPEENESETDLIESNKFYVEYMDVVHDFTAETEGKLQFTYLEINGNGILYEDDASLNELIKRSVDVYNDVENENLNIRNDLEIYKTQSNDLETRLDDVKTEYEFNNHRYRSLSQRIISKFPFLAMIRYLPRTGLKTALINRKGYQAIKKNNLLDIGYYLNTYSDVKLTGKDPIIHYLYHGSKEGRNPSREFDSDYYSETYPDIKKTNLNPLVHYALYGINENRNTLPNETETESNIDKSNIYLNKADMSIEGCVKTDDGEEVRDIVLRIDNENFKLKTWNGTDENGDKLPVFKFNIFPSFIDGKKHEVRVYDGVTGAFILKRMMTFTQPRKFRDLSGFLENSLVSPRVYAPFREQDKRCFATMENISKYLTSQSNKNDKKPLISVIIPVYNSIPILKAAINSVLNQSYPNIEIVVVDGGSSDGSYEYLKSLNNENLILIQNPDCREVSSARNLALTAVHGDYVSYLNPDCTWDSRYLSTMMGAFAKLEDADAVYSGQLLFDENEEYPFAVNYGSLNRSLLENRNYIDLNSLCHKHDIYKRIGGFDESLEEYTDWDWIMRMVNNFEVYSIPVLLSNCHNQKNQEIFDENHLELLRKKQSQRSNETKAQIKNVENLKGVSIVIPSYESFEDIQECLNAILDLNLNQWVEIIVVDNNSSKTVTDYLTKMESESKIKLIKNQINYGFTYAVNQGIEIAEDGNDILLMNNDAMVTPGSIEAMQNAAYKLEDCGLVVPKQTLQANCKTVLDHVPYASLDYECDVNISGLFDNMLNIPLFHSGRYVEINFAPFFCVYIKNEVIKNSCGLDAEYGRHYRSDRMYCNYIRHVMNLRIYHTSKANVYHKLQQSTDVLKEKSQKEYDIMFKKNQWDDKLAAKFGYRQPLWDF